MIEDHARSDEEILADIESDRNEPGRLLDSAPLRDLFAAVEARTRAEAEVEARVAEARAAGLSWGLIGSALGISRQGAQKRYGAR